MANSMGGFAIPASQLVRFDKDITNSIEYVFGNTVKLYFFIVQFNKNFNKVHL